MSCENEIRIVHGQTPDAAALDRELDPDARRANRREFARSLLGEPPPGRICAHETELSFCAVDDDSLGSIRPYAYDPANDSISASFSTGESMRGSASPSRSR